MNDQEFIHRKVDHLRYALHEAAQAKARAEWDAVELVHDSLPDLNLDDVSLTTSFLNARLPTPFYVAGMTAGHPEANELNDRLAKFAAKRGWIFGLGSQRRELSAGYADQPSHALKKRYPELQVISNLGIAQLIEIHSQNNWTRLAEIVEQSGTCLLAIHLNPVQEAIQSEGTPHFKGGLSALEELCEKISVPLVLKETDSGMSTAFLERIRHLEPFAVDVSGLGGTHWGRVEGLRAPEQSQTSELGVTFKDWGVATLTSVMNARSVFQDTHTEVWASGGVRNGLDAAKAIALGATRAGFAKSALEAALKGDEALEEWMKAREAELRIALFCTNSASLTDLNDSKIEPSFFTTQTRNP